jgi:hypothetical protein
MSGVTSTAVLQPLPSDDDLHIVIVGATATSAIDLFTTFGIDPQATSRPRSRITIGCTTNAIGYVADATDALGAPDLASATTPTRCWRLPADQERSHTLTLARRYMRIVAADADTRVQIHIERG